MASPVYRPGHIVPRSGIYRIEHDEHRLMHHAALTQDSLFPRCRTCKAGVKYHLVRHVKGHVLPFRESGILEDYVDNNAA